jgi:YVTN family beta-propeller protein
VATSGPPHDLAVDPRRGWLWVTIDGSSSVEVRSAATGRLLHRPLLGAAPHDVGFAAGYRSVWFSNWNSGSLTVVDAGSRRVRARIGVGQEPHHFAAGAGALWVSDNGGGLLLRVELRSGRVRARARVGAAPHHVAIAGEDVLVAVHGTDRVALVSRDGRLRRTVHAGDGPHGIAAIELASR